MTQQELLEKLGELKRQVDNAYTIFETMDRAFYDAMKKRHGRKVNFLYRSELYDTPEICKLHAAKNQASYDYHNISLDYSFVRGQYLTLYGQTAEFNLLVYGHVS